MAGSKCGQEVFCCDRVFFFVKIQEAGQRRELSEAI
jgi:hypothetical protein